MLKRSHEAGLILRDPGTFDEFEWKRTVECRRTLRKAKTNLRDHHSRIRQPNQIWDLPQTGDPNSILNLAATTSYRIAT